MFVQIFVQHFNRDLIYIVPTQSLLTVFVFPGWFLTSMMGVTYLFAVVYKFLHVCPKLFKFFKNIIVLMYMRDEYLYAFVLKNII